MTGKRSRLHCILKLDSGHRHRLKTTSNNHRPLLNTCEARPSYCSRLPVISFNNSHILARHGATVPATTSTHVEGSQASRSPAHTNLDGYQARRAPFSPHETPVLPPHNRHHNSRPVGARFGKYFPSRVRRPSRAVRSGGTHASETRWRATIE